LIWLSVPRGGIDKRCCIQVTLKGPAAVVIEDTESSLYHAIDRAADRAGRSVMRRLARHNERPARRETGRRVAGEEPGNYATPTST